MTEENNLSWRQLSLEFKKGVHSALIHQHHAVQLIALAGKYLLPQQHDDSNTNMQYQSTGEWIIGNELPGGFRIALNLPLLKIFIINKSQKPYTEIPLSCRTKTEVFDDLKQKLSDLGINVSELIQKLHYEIPGHELDGKAAFLLDTDQEIRETIFYRHNAEIILNQEAAKFEKAQPVRIWPHHFDTGTVVPLDYSGEGAILKSIGLGWAIPDSMVNEPYYYLSYRSDDPVANFSNLPDLLNGEWINTGWNGGILKNSDLLKASDSDSQQKMVTDFFDSGIRILSKQFNF